MIQFTDASFISKAGRFLGVRKNIYALCFWTHNPLYAEWDLRESTSVQASGRVIITAEMTKCPTELQKGKERRKRLFGLTY